MNKSNDQLITLAISPCNTFRCLKIIISDKTQITLKTPKMLSQLNCRDSLWFKHNAEIRQAFRSLIENILPLQLFVFQCAILPVPFCDNLARDLNG